MEYSVIEKKTIELKGKKNLKNVTLNDCRKQIHLTTNISKLTLNRFCMTSSKHF